MSNSACKAFAGSQGRFELNAMRPVVNNDLHPARILADAYRRCRLCSAEGTKLGEERVRQDAAKWVRMLSPVIGCHKASRIARAAMDEERTLRQAALKPGEGQRGTVRQGL